MKHIFQTGENKISRKIKCSVPEIIWSKSGTHIPGYELYNTCVTKNIIQKRVHSWTKRKKPRRHKKSEVRHTGKQKPCNRLMVDTTQLGHFGLK